jgi:hypothetical protein
MDTAGNPFIISAPDTLMIDTTSPLLVGHWPTERTFDSEIDARSVATFTDGDGSGVDMTTVEYSISLGGKDEFGPWVAVNSTGSADDVVRGEIDILAIDGHDNWISWRVRDLVGNGPVEFGPFQLKINLPPNAVIASPIEGGRFYHDEQIWLSGVGSSDPDPDDDLVFEWWSDIDGYLGMGRELPGVLSVGDHELTLKLDDGIGGDHVAVATTTMTVIERMEVKEPLSPWLIILLITISVGTVAALREYKKRRWDRFEEIP